MAKIHTLTYNGTKSSDLGIFVTGSGSFDAAEFDVDKYEIPGRNGDLVLSNNRYKNIEITYPAFIPKAFMDKAQNVRNWLRSSKVYARLEDTYDMDHYRLGIPTGVQSFSPENRNDGANFEMTFDCKPQRFLKVGETPETVEAETKTASGEIASFDSVAVVPLTSAEVSLSPQQDLNGYDSPWPAGGGKNLFDGSAVVFNADSTASALNGITLTKYSNGTFNINGTASAETRLKFTQPIAFKSGKQYAISIRGIGGEGLRVILQGNPSSSGIQYTSEYPSSDWMATYSISGDCTFNYFFVDVQNGASVNFTLSVQIEVGSSPTSWTPYSNICPISGHAGAELKIGATYPTAVNTYSVTFTDQGIVYGGTVDLVTGELKVTWAAKTYNGSEAWYPYGTQGYYIRNNAIKKIGQTASGGVGYVGAILCDKLKTFPSNLDASFIQAKYGITGWSNLARVGENYLYIKVGTTSAVDTATVQAWLADNPITVTYVLVAPLEYTLTPQQIETLLGENNVWSDAGPITLTYAEPYTIENPTQFDARPLFTVTNPADGDVITVNGQAITFVDGYTGTVFIDCETMNAYSGAANLNSIIEATDFPVLVPGTNIITWTGSGECTMTPRWWEL